VKINYLTKLPLSMLIRDYLF